MNEIQFPEYEEVKLEIVKNFPQNPIMKFENLFYFNTEPVCGLEILVRDDEIVLNNIRTFEGYENKGHATMALLFLKDIAEKSRFIITGQIEPNGKQHLDKKQLESWYSKNGFNIEKNRIAYYPLSLISAKYKKSEDTDTATYLVFEAKRRAEVTPGVGALTDMIVLYFDDQNQLVSKKLTEEELNKLDEVYKEVNLRDPAVIKAKLQEKTFHI